MKQIKFFIKHILRIIIGFFLSILFKRKNNYIVFNAKYEGDKEYFLHNTKYLFLHLISNEKYKDFKVFWLCDDKNIAKAFKNRGINNCISRHSLKGMYYMLKSKYWFSDYGLFYKTPIFFIDKAIKINMWHGTGGLKKSGADDEKCNLGNIKKLKKIIYNTLQVKDSYYTVDNEREGKNRTTQFDSSDKQILITGSPRIDVLYRDFENQDLFMEKDYENIRSLKTKGKKLIFYTPTFRETGKDISSWLKSTKLKEFLITNNAVLVCKLHPFDTNSLNFELTEEFYKMDKDSDLHAVLKCSDVLISDYSGIYFDYLLLDKPIIYYVPDLYEFQEQCRGFYEPYEKLTAGEITYNESELLTAMQNALYGMDNYKEKRKTLRDRTFVYQDGENCERVIETIMNLEK